MGEGTGMRISTVAVGDSTCCQNPDTGTLLLALPFYRVEGEADIAATARLAFEETGGIWRTAGGLVSPVREKGSARLNHMSPFGKVTKPFVIWRESFVI